MRSFRFQWPADLLTSWGFEMENVILGWYILVATGSVVLLTAFASIQYLGTLFAPVIGMAGDRIGHRTVLCAMRASYAVSGNDADGLGPQRPAGPGRGVRRRGAVRHDPLVRPGDAQRAGRRDDAGRPVHRRGGRGAHHLGFGAGGRLAGGRRDCSRRSAWGAPYVAITCFYLSGFLLTLGVGAARGRHLMGGVARTSMWRDLREGLSYVWDTPASLAAMWLAFLVNMTAFPLTSGLLPYVAREIYHINQTGLGYLVASFAIGALLGSVAISVASRLIRPARMMIVFALVWYAMLLVFVRMPTVTGGSAMLVLAGFAQSLSMVPMSVMLLHSAGPRFRGRVMGVRMFAIYGLPLGLLPAGALIDRIAFAPTATLYCCIGLAGDAGDCVAVAGRSVAAAGAGQSAVTHLTHGPRCWPHAPIPA